MSYFNSNSYRFLIIAVILLASLFTLNVAEANGVRIRPPYNGQYPLTSFFDHYYPNYGTTDGVTIYTGESVSNCSPHCYQGHPGYDWGMEEGTPLLAVSSGIVEDLIYSSSGYGNRIILKHANGYRSLYAHLRVNNPFNVSIDDIVEEGDLIGWSGSTGTTGAHLHFGVYRGPVTSDESNVTDPWGWRGSYIDPLNQFGDGHTASCLWRSNDVDPISCYDTIVEDAAAGFTLSGTWGSSNIGNGFHMYFRSTTTGNDHAVWCLPTSYPGIYKFYAWIPWENAYSQSADYGIWTIYGWETVTINQQSYSNEWVHLGTFSLDTSINPSYNCVVLNADTGEPPGTKLVGVDAIKIRTYPVFLPLIIR